jgi:tetratricopeptide (TPR) repeat protein
VPVQRLFILVVSFLTGFAHAEGANSIMRISYASQAWNTDSKKVDTAFVVLRDKGTGKLVTIQLEETEPDSSEFSGQFSISLPDIEKFQPEVYIPPQELRGHDPDNKKLLAMIQASKLSRKPLILKRNSRGQTVVDVYDTREQAESALKAYQEQQKLAQEMRRKKPLKPMTGDSAMAAAQAVERKAALDKLAFEATQHAQDRVRLEQIERQKAKEREEHEHQLTEQERAERQEKARQVGAEALALYDQSDFSGAEGKFKQAIELDPENKDYYYKYGITLYRNQKFNDALVVLKIAKVEPNLELERWGWFTIGWVSWTTL